MNSFTILAGLMQAVVLACLLGRQYDLSHIELSSSLYNYYVGVAVMMFVGFGYLMTFLKNYGLEAVGMTMFITCLGCQWALVLEKLMTQGFDFTVGLMDFLNMNFAVAAVLISFGALIGRKTNTVQLLVVTIFELVFYCLNKVYILENKYLLETLVEFVCYIWNIENINRTPVADEVGLLHSSNPYNIEGNKLLDVQDCGGTIIIHVFGAYFGLACSYALGRASDDEMDTNSYTADIFSLFGTVFLWLYWPSFVAGGIILDNDGQTEALMNTVFALAASTVTTFAITPLLNANRFTTAPIQNATLAGGVAIGATANFAMGPSIAMLVGIFAGLISTIGFCKPLIPVSIDTCGINNLHGMPGIFGGLVSVAMPYIMNPHGESLSALAITQAVGLVVTVGIALVTGSITGGMLSWPCFAKEDVVKFLPASFY